MLYLSDHCLTLFFKNWKNWTPKFKKSKLITFYFVHKSFEKLKVPYWIHLTKDFAKPSAGAAHSAFFNVNDSFKTFNKHLYGHL